MHLTPAQCKENDLTVSECTFIHDHFDTLKAEYQKVYLLSKSLGRKIPFEYETVLRKLYD